MFLLDQFQENQRNAEEQRQQNAREDEERQASEEIMARIRAQEEENSRAIKAAARIREEAEKAAEARKKAANGNVGDEDAVTDVIENSDPEEFKKFFKDLDQDWLQKTIVTGLMVTGSAINWAEVGATVGETATAIVEGLEVFGPLLLLL